MGLFHRFYLSAALCFFASATVCFTGMESVEPFKAFMKRSAAATHGDFLNKKERPKNLTKQKSHRAFARWLLEFRILIS